MQKLTTLLICFVVAICATAQSALPTEFAKYDLNNDNQITNADAQLIYNYILGTTNDSLSFEQVDVNQDGSINTLDVVEVYVSMKKFALPTEVTLNFSEYTLAINESLQLIATIKPSNATDKNITWHSSNSSVANVNENGLVIGKSIGTTTITSTSHNGKSASCSITVIAPASKGIEGYSYDSDDSEFGY